MHILQVATQVTTLGEVLLADDTFVWPLPIVLPEVVPQIATLLEDAITAINPALELELHSEGLSVLLLEDLVPGVGHILEGLCPISSRVVNAFELTLKSFIFVRIVGLVFT